MSTRAIYTVLGEKRESPIHIYIHYNGYPSGASEHINNALPYAWGLPRFEADEFAAALVAGNKFVSGSVRIFPSVPFSKLHTLACNIAYRYEITEREGVIMVTCYSTDYWDELVETKLFAGTLASFTEWSKTNQI